MFLLSFADFFQNRRFQKILSGTLSECQTVWIQIRTDILSVLIWFQTVCKAYQQTTKVTTSEEIVKYFFIQKMLSAYYILYYFILAHQTSFPLFCKGYLQTTKVGTSKEKLFKLIPFLCLVILPVIGESGLPSL